MQSHQPDPSSRLNRRRFLQTSTTAIAGISAAQFSLTAAGAETLAVNGGPKAVTCPAKRHSDLTRWPRYGEDEKKAVCDLLDKMDFYPELTRFENEWKAYTGSNFVKAHMNGSSALTSMYFALDLPPGSEIMVPSYTFVTACLAMRFVNCVPIFIDIDPKTATFSLEDAHRKLTPKTKAVCVMHSWGLPCEMDRIEAWTKEKGLYLLEDAAHAHGASMQGRKMGTWGLMGIYSFQTSKVMPCVEGGMGMYQKREHFERAAAFGEYLDPAKFPADSPVRAYEGTGFGQKYRMHPLGASLGRQQLKRLDSLNALVAANVKKMNASLTQLEALTEPRVRPDQQRVYYNGNMLLIDFKKLGVSRDKLVKALAAEGVSARFWDYPQQHKLKIYSEAKWWQHSPAIPESMPGNEYINANHIFVPAFYEEAPDVIEQYVKAFQKVWANRASIQPSRPRLLPVAGPEVECRDEK
jgi:dTDP-4-amino-4,6-dideoxygalactose transaminase